MERQATRFVQPVGRVDFVLRTLLVTAVVFVLEFLGDRLLYLALLPHFFYVLQRVIVFGLIGFFLFAVIDGRVAETGLPRWWRYPAFFVWLLSTSLPVLWPPTGRVGLALFLLLLVVGCSIPAGPAMVKCASIGGTAEPEQKSFAPAKKYRARFFVTQVGFLRSLLTLACLWLPLVWLEDISVGDPRVWIARLGYLILTIVWLFTLFGRLDDAGRLSHAGFGSLFFWVVPIMRALLRYRRAGSATGWQAHLLADAASITSRLSLWWHLLNGYELLGLFLLIQIPLAFLPTKPKPPELLAEIRRHAEDRERRVPAVKENELAQSGPFEYLRIVLVIALLFLPLIYLDDAFRGTIGSWIARLGYFVLVFFWFAFVNGRFEDAGLANKGYPPQYLFVVSVASLMPLAVHWVNAYEALVIFVLIQTPTALLRSKPAPEPPPEGGG